MAQEITTVMVLGGRGGNGGPHMISALAKAGFDVSVLSRNSSTDSATTFQGVPVVRSDYSFSSLVDVFNGQDAVVSAIPTSDTMSQKAIIDAAVAAKVKRFLPGEFGSDTEPDLEDVASFLKSKKEVVAYLETKEKEGLTWTGLCTGPWVDWMLLEGKGLLGFDTRAKTATIFDDGDIPFTTSTMARIGEALASVLRHPTQTMNRYVQVSSFTLTQNMLLESLERMSRSKFNTTGASVAETHDTAKRDLELGNWEAGYYQMVNAVTFSGSELICFSDKSTGWNKILGLAQGEQLDEMVARVLKMVDQAL